MYVYRRELNSSTLLQVYLESTDENIKEFENLYNEIVKHSNDLQLSLENYFLASLNIKCIHQNNWLKILTNKNSEDSSSIIECARFIEMITDCT